MTTSTWIPPDSFGDRLMRARKARKLTVERAAAAAGVSAATWSTWERGAHPRDLIDVVSRVSDGLDVSRDWLLWGGSMSNTSGWSGDRPTPADAVDDLIAA
jgi:transcriptional regulator with XRE-family HTH domain